MHQRRHGLFRVGFLADVLHRALPTGSRRSESEVGGGTDGRPGRSKWQRQVDPVSFVATPLRLHSWPGE